MGPEGAVVTPPALHEHLGFAERVEVFGVEQAPWSVPLKLLS